TATAIGRKTKPCTFIKSGTGTKNAYEHQIFLQLSSPVATGSSVTVTAPAGLTPGRPSSRTGPVAPTQRPRRAIHVNQVGYKTNSQKLFQMSAWLGDMNGTGFHTFTGSTFRVLNAATRAQVYSGTYSLRHANGVDDDGFHHNHYKTDLFEGDF